MKIASSFGPGPGQFNLRNKKVGGTEQTIAIRYKLSVAPTAGSEYVAPGHYNHTNKFLKKSPSTCFGNERRKFSTSGTSSLQTPGPDAYTA
jgi:hypothetical protein